MDFAALILALVLYYIRPQEWMLPIQPLKPMTLVMALAVIAVIARTGLSWRQLFKTPHDWLILTYCVWMVVTSPDRGQTFGEVYPLLIFYLVAVQALTNVKRMRQFLVVWTLMIFTIAAAGVCWFLNTIPQIQRDEQPPRQLRMSKIISLENLLNRE